MLSLFRYHNYKQENEYLVKIIDKVAIGEARSTLGPGIPKLS